MMRGKAAHLHVPRPTISENLDAEDFPDQLEQLAKDVKTFLNCLNEFPEFTDEAVNASILSFEGDLRVRALLIIYPLSLITGGLRIVLGIMFA